MIVGELLQRRSQTTFWSRDDVALAHRVDGVTATLLTRSLAERSVMPVSPEQLRQAIQQAVAAAAQQWHEAAAQMQQEIGPCERSFRRQLKRHHYRKKCPPAWWIRDCSESQSFSPAAPAGRTGALSPEGMRVLALHSLAHSWSDRRDQQDRCSTRR